MAKLLVLISVICAVQIASAGRIVRDAPTPTLTDLAKQAEDAFSVLHKNFLEFVGVKDDQEFTSLVQKQGRDYADKLASLGNQLGEEAKANAGKADEFIKTLQRSIEGTVTELRQKNPEFFDNAEKFQKNFQDHLKTVIKDTEELNTKLKADGKELSTKVEDVLKQIYDSTVQTAQKVTTDIQTAAKKQ